MVISISGRVNFCWFGAGGANIVINLWMSAGIWCTATTTTHLKNVTHGQRLKVEIMLLNENISMPVYVAPGSGTRPWLHKERTPFRPNVISRLSGCPHISKPADNNTSNWQHAHLQWIHLITSNPIEGFLLRHATHKSLSGRCLAHSTWTCFWILCCTVVLRHCALNHLTVGDQGLACFMML